MTKQNINTQADTVKAFALKAYRAAKIVAIVVVLFTSAVGVYVIANGDLRNATIDYAQNQRSVQAAGLPKAQ